MTVIDNSGSWKSLYSSGLLGRFVVLCFGIWLHATDSLVTATIAPAIVDDIGGIAFINWTIMLYEVGAIVAGAAVPRLCQRIGIKRVMLIAAMVYGAGCAIAGFAPSMALLLVGRFSQGIGGGALLSLCYVAIEEWYAPAWWSRLFGVVALIWGAGSMLGPLIGSVFAALHSWRATFLVFALQACVLWAMASAWLPSHAPSRPAAAGWPVLPLLILSAATMIVAASSIAARVPVAVLGCVLGTALLYGAARLDRRFPSRLFPVRLLDFRHPVGAGLLMVFALSVSTTGFWAYGPLLLKILFGTKPLISGYILAAEALAWSLATLAVSRAALSAEALLIRVGAIAIVLGAGGFVLAVPAGSLPGIVACALMQGCGFGLCWPSIVQRMVRFSEEAERPLAVAAPETMGRIGYAVGTAAAGISANLSGLAAGVSKAAAKGAAFWVFAAFIPLLLIALLSAWRFTRSGAEPASMPPHS